MIKSYPNETVTYSNICIFPLETPLLHAMKFTYNEKGICRCALIATLAVFSSALLQHFPVHDPL